SRLRERGFIDWPIKSSFATGAGESRNLAQGKIKFPNLMRSSHRDVERTADQLQIPWGIQSNGSSHPFFAVFARLLPGARYRGHGPGLQIDCANQVILSIRDVKSVTVERHPLRPKEGRVIECAVVLPVRARADRFDQSAVRLRDDDAIVIRVGDEQPI